jgi:hypothetical protein
MPLPKPRSGESRDTFISRCMGDSVARQDFPSQDQRAAVCNRQWRDRSKDDDMTGRGAIRIRHSPWHDEDE